MIFIGKNHNGTVVSIISAKSKEIANAYWQGLNICPFQIEEFGTGKDIENERGGYVTTLLRTREKKMKGFDSDYHNVVVVD